MLHWLRQKHIVHSAQQAGLLDMYAPLFCMHVFR